MPLRLRAPARPAADDDRSLVRRFARHGDQAAFAALVDRHGPLVLGVCRRIVRDPHLAEDAFQAVFVVLARKAGSVTVGASLANWLFGVARRVALAARRREFRARGAELAARSDNLPPAPPAPDWDDLLRVLDDELARLSDKLRAPVVECFFREKTQDEAARALGWSLSTLRRRLDRAKDVLRARLTARGVALPAALFAGSLAASTAMAHVSPALAQSAVNAGVVTGHGGAVAGSIATLAQGGMGMSGIAKFGATAAALGVFAAAGAGVGYGLGWWPAAQAAPPPVVTAPAAQTPAPPAGTLPTEERPKAAPAPAPIEKSRPAGPARTPADAPPMPSAQPAAAGDWATIRGRVVWPGAAPKPPLVNVTTDREHCQSQGPLVHEDLIVNPNNRGVRYVVVWLRPDSEDRKAPFPKDRVHPALAASPAANHVVDQPCCQFVPRVVAARVGDTVEFKNSAPVNHNVNYASDAEPFNYSMPPILGTKRTTPLQMQTSPIPFKCDIHPWMHGRIRVFDHPYFAVTDGDGSFEIQNAPAGRWRVVYWHENGYHKGRDGLLGFPVEVKGGAVELPPVELELPK